MDCVYTADKRDGLLRGNLDALVGKVGNGTAVVGHADEGGGELKAQLVGLVVNLGEIVQVLKHAYQEVVDIDVCNVVVRNDDCAHSDGLPRR